MGIGLDLQDQHEDDQIVKAEWGNWQQTFLFLPKKDILGNTILGPAWCRMIKCRIMEYEDKTGYFVYTNAEHTQYARNKKDIFISELNK